MSIINNANPGSSLVLIPLIDRILQNASIPLAQEMIVERYRPNNLPANDNSWGKIRENLAFWCRLGLWPMKDDKILPLENEPRPLYQRLLQCAIDACRDKGIENGNDCEPLWRVLACLMALQQHSFGGQDPLAPNIITAKIKRWLPNETVNTNTEKLVREYGRFLGFLEPGPNQVYYTDPTRAIQCFLPQIFGNEKRLSISAFMANMAEVMPMMDGGTFRVKVQEMMAEQGWSSPEGHNISTSTSLALKRLEISQRIMFEGGSDDEDSLSLQLPGNNIRRVSYVSLREDMQ